VFRDCDEGLGVPSIPTEREQRLDQLIIGASGAYQDGLDIDVLPSKRLGVILER